MITGIAHIGIAVTSIEEARQLWEAMGLEIEAIEEVPHEGVRVAMIPCGDAHIELLEPIGDDSPVRRFLDSRGPGIHHICLASDDIGADDARLRTAGARLLRDRPTEGAGGTRVQFIHPKSAGGVLVELAGGGGRGPGAGGQGPGTGDRGPGAGGQAPPPARS